MKRACAVFFSDLEARLTINPAKCKFFQSRLDFLGHLISAAGIASNKAKVKAVSRFPIPTDVTQVKSFLGFKVFSRLFIKDYGGIAAPLTHILKKDVPLCWDKEQFNAFRKLNACFRFCISEV